MNTQTRDRLRALAEKARDAEQAMLALKPWTREFYAARKVALAALGGMAAELPPEAVLSLARAAS